MSLKSVLGVVAALIITVTAAQGQEGPMPADIAARLKALGRVIDPPRTAALYAPLQQREPYPGVRIERDIEYGASIRNLLDVFMPETAALNRGDAEIAYFGSDPFYNPSREVKPSSPARSMSDIAPF